LEILESFGTHPRRKSVCPCGCNSWRSSNFKWWEELLLWRSWRQWIAYKRGLVSGNPTKEYIEENNARILEATRKLAEAEDMPGEELIEDLDGGEA
jgi:hypothetical protein